ncbi:stage II sporulation protein M [Sphingomonas sp. S1-29]|uniref:stage II sporulation protein M n=1 Tax=Sphingomonas sp. S1-29 TaxID=2991074 RepID=UPI00223F24CC|nr:stage II sporulation protein M [Sphingomonas sp. S1-29]UZK70528.1 stage II sporulation protein M [Sphingomonas sp. S1-29]
MTTPFFTTRNFRAEREGDWARLEALLDIVEKRSAKRLSSDELVELPRLYRATLSALSIARETSLDASLVGYLESLATRAYFILYSGRTPMRRQLLGFFARGWPQAVRRMVPEILLALALFAASAVAGYALVVADPAWFAGIVDEGMASGRNMEASAAFLRDTLYGAPKDSGLEVFATQLFTHNAQISILVFALGFAFGVPTMLLLASNGALMGAFFAVYVPHGLGWGLLGWLSIHGTTEIFAILISAGAGFHIGRAVAFPEQRTRMAAASEAGRRAAIAMIGVVVMLLVAGLLEGFARQLVRTDEARFAIALTMLAGWVAYFAFGGRARGQG